MYQLFKYEDDFKWKNFELQNCNLVESYNFHIKFTSIRVHAKKLQFFERKLKTEI
jgi:hypothetical protein